jgi:hypothetical protein
MLEMHWTHCRCAWREIWNDSRRSSKGEVTKPGHGKTRSEASAIWVVDVLAASKCLVSWQCCTKMEGGPYDDGKTMCESAMYLCGRIGERVLFE